ncbi:MAG TPA: hypothetical protein VFJ43_04610, partial [Bacteroidia bacterium]|nr:hypothetical protein [Bacteroidia bacterium]
MSFLKEALDFVLHINDHLDSMVMQYGTLIYGILFAIIFVETGVVIMPFLPGDSLLFAAGAICARHTEAGAPMNILVLILLLSVAAILGDNSNYAIGRFLGTRAVNLKIGKRKLVKQANIDRTHSFFEKYG